jgi:hypothetical protein
MQKQTWISTEDLRIIARNIKDIYDVHVRLLAKLEACSQNYHWENIHNRYCQLADVFVTMVRTYTNNDICFVYVLVT